MDSIDNNLLVEAAPTKDLFIYMLTRDINLIDAIVDLTDNSIDGARRLRSDDRYDDLWVRIEATQKHFKITDNCGGLDEDTARHYAFRFGRPPGMPSTRHSVGQFGVGMKRSLFKLGRKFQVESRTDTGYFRIEVNVDEWKERPEWEFRFDELAPQPPTDYPDATNTRITVTDLYESVAESFGLENFLNHLRSRLKYSQREAIAKGLTISLNKLAIEEATIYFLQSDELKVANRENTIEGNSPMNIRLLTGVAASDPNSAGWHVFCNGRLVLQADKSLTTGWGENSGTTIPVYHNQFARFRACAFFDCDDAGLLPWNTTKNGVNMDSLSYTSARLQMIMMMRPVIDFLNKLDMEKNQDDKPLENAINNAKLVSLSEVIPAERFEIVVKVSPQKPSTRNITYSRPAEDIERVRDILGAKTLREVGEKTFDYFYESECVE